MTAGFSSPGAAAAARSIGIVLGDPHGIGPEIALKAACALAAQPGAPRPVLIGDAYIVDHYAELAGLSSDLRARYRVVDVGALRREDWRPGQVDAKAGAATVQYVEAAVRLWRTGEVAAIAAGPHSETAINAAGIRFSGYSGLLADLTGTPREQLFLMLEACGLRVVHATLHERLADALARLDPSLVEAAALAAHAAVRRLGIADPSVCLLGINPHAGENGLFGDDDERVNLPAAARLRDAGLRAEGPVGADLALAERRYDCYVAMFHDQGHIAVKMLSPKGATAVVAGAPVLFASVGHGAAFDIAGQGGADASALTATVRLLAEAA